MSILLYGAGAIAFVAGGLMVAFGIPINEFSFGNTLILAGTTAIIGGMIVAGLGVAVSQLQRIADALGRGASPRSGRPANTVDGGRLPARIPFPPRNKAELKAEVPEPASFAPAAPFHDAASDQAAPTLPNPDEPPVTVDDEVSLSPRHPFAPAPSAERDDSLPPPPFSLRDDIAEPEEPRDPPSAFDAGWRSPPKAPVAPSPRQSTYFDSMWPAEPKIGEPKEPKETKPAEPKFESPYAPQPRATTKPAEPDPEVQPEIADEAPEPADDQRDEAPKDGQRSVAILKSGVVDGMGYTLYVDGSIEAELPQGTLHFASINELRSHLEKTS